MDWKVPNKKLFPRDISGNVSTLFIVMSVPIVAAVGGSLDMGMAASTKSKMQNALDAAATAVCGAGTKDPEEVLRDRLAASISEFGLTLMPPPEEGQEQGTPSGNQALVLNTTFDTGSGSMIPSLSTNMPTTVLSIVGMSEMNLEVTTSVKCGAKRLELSLMLDVTGSMGWKVNGVRKIDSLKVAAHDVLDIFEGNMQLGAARIALVPFSEAVNLGPLAEAVRGTVTPGVQWSPGWQNYKFYDRWGYYRNWHAKRCVTERLGAERYTDAPPSSAPVGLMYRSSSSNCKPNHAEITPLTSDKALLGAQIDSFSASGGTAGHIGTAWAWYTLSDKWGYLWPNSAPEVPNPEELIKATILMTDGEYNTQYKNGVNSVYLNGTSPNGSSKDQAAALCTAMKAQGVVVYAVGFGLNPNGSTAQRLKDCASDDTKWFFPYDGDELRAAFQSIGQQLAAGQAGEAVINQ